MAGRGGVVFGLGPDGMSYSGYRTSAAAGLAIWRQSGALGGWLNHQPWMSAFLARHWEDAMTLTENMECTEEQPAASRLSRIF